MQQPPLAARATTGCGTSTARSGRVVRGGTRARTVVLVATARQRGRPAHAPQAEAPASAQPIMWAVIRVTTAAPRSTTTCGSGR